MTLQSTMGDNFLAALAMINRIIMNILNVIIEKTGTAEGKTAFGTNEGLGSSFATSSFGWFSTTFYRKGDFNVISSTYTIVEVVLIMIIGQFRCDAVTGCQLHINIGHEID